MYRYAYPYPYYSKVKRLNFMRNIKKDKPKHCLIFQKNQTHT